MAHWIGDTYRSTVGWSLLEELVNIGNRMAGSDGEDAGATAVEATFDEIGIETVFTESLPMTGWERGGSTLTVGEEEHACIVLPRAPAGSVSGELVDLGYGLPTDFENADLEGKIAMVRSDIPDYHDRYIHRREKYFRAYDAGAVGFVYRNHVEGQLAPTGSVAGKDDPIGPIPAVGVSYEVGAKLARRYDGQQTTLTTDATIDETETRNVHAVIGPETDERVLVTAHHDAHDIAEGAMDNGAGTAMVAEIGRALQHREAELDYGVELIVFGAEEVGLLGSSYDAAHREQPVRAVLNTDSPVAERDLKISTHGSDELTAAVREAADRLGHSVTITPNHNPHSDHWPYVTQGIPGLMALSDRGTGRGWGHTTADTFDKLDQRNLQEQSLLLTELATILADDSWSFPRRDRSAIATELEEQNLAEGMRLTGSWPFEQ